MCRLSHTLWAISSCRTVSHASFGASVDWRLAVSAAPEADVYVVSYPKSGRTWLRVLIGKALCLHCGWSDDLLLDTPALTSAAGALGTHFTHDGADLREWAGQDSLSADSRVYRDRRVVFLVRDPRDVLVSSYFETTRRSFVFEDSPVSFDGSLSEFVRSPLFGARRLAAFHHAWTRGRAAPRRFLLLRYERLRAAPTSQLRRILRFIGAEAVTRDAIAGAVEFATIENMRRLERADAFGDPCLRPGDRSDPQSYKARRGVVRGYVDYLSPADIEYVDRVLAGCR